MFSCLLTFGRHTLAGYFLLLLLVTPPLHAREITDMAGHRVTIPDTITKVVAASPPATYLIYAIDPSLLAGLNFPLWGSEKKYTVPGYRKLPVIGGLAGQGRAMNQEMLLTIRPDLLVHWSWRDDATNNKFLDLHGETALSSGTDQHGNH